MINILIVDDSLTETAILKAIFESDPSLRVIGTARNGKEGLEMVSRLKPDLITMDIHMPVMNGLEATRQIMAQYPTPIVVISSKLNNIEINTTFLALEAGALSVLDKPCDITSSQFLESKKNILSHIHAMAEIKVVKKRSFTKNLNKNVHLASVPNPNIYEVLAIGTSVGGPQILKRIFEALPNDFPLPIVVVQHMTTGFIAGFTHWLRGHTSLNVKLANHHEILQKGTVYFAPDGSHLEVARSKGKLVAHLVNDEPVSGFRPSITVLLKSIAKVCGNHAVGAILTGMGSDGAEGLLALKKAGGHTLIQDSKSSVVFGMASVAKSLGAVDKIIEAGQFSDYFIQITKSHSK